MTTYVFTPDGLMNKATGVVEPFNRDAKPCLPRIDTGDSHEPLLSMADGKYYTSKAAMRESYKAKNNAQGVEYVEVGDQRSQGMASAKKDNTGLIKESVSRAMADLDNGRFNN